MFIKPTKPNLFALLLFASIITLTNCGEEEIEPIPDVLDLKILDIKRKYKETYLLFSIRINHFLKVKVLYLWP